jgi:hypothetical protein
VVDPDVVTAKLDIVDRCLQRIVDVRGPRREDFHEWDLTPAVRLVPA